METYEMARRSGVVEPLINRIYRWSMLLFMALEITLLALCTYLDWRILKVLLREK